MKMSPRKNLKSRGRKNKKLRSLTEKVDPNFKNATDTLKSVTMILEKYHRYLKIKVCLKRSSGTKVTLDQKFS